MRALLIGLSITGIVIVHSAAAAPGDLDPTFGTGGVVESPSVSAGALVLQADGKLVVAGSGYPGSFLLARYASDGSVDTDFGTGGTVVTPFGASNEFATAITQQADGKLVAAGVTYPDGPNDFALARYSSDGTLDASFGSSGIVGTSSMLRRPAAVIQQGDGKIVVAGQSWNGTEWRFTLVRYESNGSVDGAFGIGGEVTAPAGGADALLQQPDGKLVAAGYFHSGLNEDFAVVRYEPDGTLDASFGTGGQVVTPIGPVHDHGYAVVRQADGKLVVAGLTDTTAGTSVVLVRYDVDGTPDSTFGSNGIGAMVPGAKYLGFGLVQQSDGKLVATASLENGALFDFGLARWNPDGTLDPSFGGDGIVTTHIGSYNDYPVGLVLQPDGKLVMAGNAFTPGVGVLARFESGLCCPGDVCVACATCETCGIAGCEASPAGFACPDDGDRCTNDRCDGGGACLHPFEPAPVCTTPTVSRGASLRIRSSAVAGADRLQFKWGKGPAVPDFDTLTLSLCVYDGSGSGYDVAYRGDPDDGLWLITGTGFKWKSETGGSDGITNVVLKRSQVPFKAKIQVKAKGDLVLAPLPLMQSPAVVAQVRTAAGQCWGAGFSSAKRNDGAQFVSKSD